MRTPVHLDPQCFRLLRSETVCDATAYTDDAGTLYVSLSVGRIRVAVPYRLLEGAAYADPEHRELASRQWQQRQAVDLAVNAFREWKAVEFDARVLCRWLLASTRGLTAAELGAASSAIRVVLPKVTP